MAKQTAVEWLVNQIGVIDINDPYYSKIFKQAKEMDKQQIMTAYQEGIKNGYIDYIDTEWGRDSTIPTPEEYYEDTYGK